MLKGIKLSQDDGIPGSFRKIQATAQDGYPATDDHSKTDSQKQFRHCKVSHVPGEKSGVS
jgi:hypothetical protein